MYEENLSYLGIRMYVQFDIDKLICSGRSIHD